jgi:hypothetical protein
MEFCVGFCHPSMSFTQLPADIGDAERGPTILVARFTCRKVCDKLVAEDDSAHLGSARLGSARSDDRAVTLRSVIEIGS